MKPWDAWEKSRYEVRESFRVKAKRILAQITPALVAEAAAKEREACAKVAEYFADCDYAAMNYPEEAGMAASNTAHEIRVAIRGRGGEG